MDELHLFVTWEVTCANYDKFYVLTADDDWVQAGMLAKEALTVFPFPAYPLPDARIESIARVGLGYRRAEADGLRVNRPK